MTNDFINKKIGFISLGCDKNRVDLEKMIFSLKNAGLTIVSDPSEANIIIINTCAFLESARIEAINNILEMSEYKSKNLEKLIVTGCINELNYPDLKESLPEVDAFVNISDNDKIVEIISNLYNESISFNETGRILTTPNHYAYLKISDGCNNFCTYCLIPYIRGRFKSTPIEDLIDEAEKLADNGVQELILVAQDVTKYGIDIYKKKSLVELINKLSQIDKIKWIRLLYCYPEEIDDELIDVIKNNPKVVKYLDIPLQHISDNILKSMNRRSTNKKIKELFAKLKSNIPGLVLRTTFILGFPNESDEDFRQIVDFIQEYNIDNVGFFKYSREEGTKSYDYPNQVPEEIKESRLQEISQIQFDIQNKLHSELIGKVFDVIIDESNLDYSVGRFYGQCPQIDTVIYINTPLKIGEFYKIKITEKLDYDLKGEVYESSK